MATDVVKRDRVGVLASTIVKELATARLNEIRKQEIEVKAPPIPMTPALLAALKQYQVGTAMRAKASAVAESAGYRIEGGYDGDNYRLTHRHHSRIEERDKKERAKQERMNQIRQLRTNTLIDLVTLDPAQAKKVVTDFRTAIEKI